MYEEKVKEFFRSMRPREWYRLVKDPYHRLEFDTTLHFIEKHLPRKGLLLDAGGGPGRYTIEMAKRGYEVILLDLLPEHLEKANRMIRRAKVHDNVKEIIEGSITNLNQFDDNTFDGVLCLGGVLSYVVDRKHREKAADELIRVAKKEAPLFISVLSRLPIYQRCLVLFPKDFGAKEVWNEILETGDYYGSIGGPPFHLFFAEDLRELFRKKNCNILEMVGLEGVSSGHQRHTNRLARRYSDNWQMWLKIHYETCTHPSVVNMSEHFMLICQKS